MPKTPERGVLKTCFRICPGNGAEWSDIITDLEEESLASFCKRLLGGMVE